jgi:hypothetical protein
MPARFRASPFMASCSLQLHCRQRALCSLGLHCPHTASRSVRLHRRDAACRLCDCLADKERRAPCDCSADPPRRAPCNCVAATPCRAPCDCGADTRHLALCDCLADIFQGKTRTATITASVNSTMPTHRYPDRTTPSRYAASSRECGHTATVAAPGDKNRHSQCTLARPLERRTSARRGV